MNTRWFLSFLPAVLYCFQAATNPRELDKFFDDIPNLEEKVRAVMARVESNQQPEIRFSAVADLTVLGDPAIPTLEKFIEGGHRERMRSALFAITKLGSDAARKALLKFFSAKKDLEGEALALLAAGGFEGKESQEYCLSVLRSKNADLYLRLTAALALAAIREPLKDDFLNLFKSETNPEIAGALAIAVGKNFGEKAIGPLLTRLSTAKEPSLRAGLWLGLAYGGGTASIEMAISDLESGDTVLAAAAAYVITDLPNGVFKERWEKVFRLADPSLKAAMIEGLGRGNEFRSRAFVFEAGQSERDLEVRKAILRTALLRHDSVLAFSVQKNRAGESLGGWWGITVSILTLEGRPQESSDAKSLMIHQLAQKISDQKEIYPEGLVLFLGAMGAREEEAILRTFEAENGSLSDAARTSRKYLRGEMDARSFQEELRIAARANGLLPEQGLRRLRLLYSTILLGAGSRFFELRTGFPNQALIMKGEKRRVRPIPDESSFYEDLWFWVASNGFGRS